MVTLEVGVLLQDIANDAPVSTQKQSFVDTSKLHELPVTRIYLSRTRDNPLHTAATDGHSVHVTFSPDFASIVKLAPASSSDPSIGGT